MPQLVDDNVKTAAYGIRDLLAVHKDSEDLINIGAYKKGSNPRIDRAIEKIDAINTFLKQRAEEPSSLAEARLQSSCSESVNAGGRMMDQKQRLHRIDRLAEVRQSYVTAAEGRVREAEHHVRICEEAAEEADRQIRRVREEIAYLDHSTGRRDSEPGTIYISRFMFEPAMRAKLLIRQGKYWIHGGMNGASPSGIKW
jgi:hypothetical protein